MIWPRKRERPQALPAKLFAERARTVHSAPAGGLEKGQEHPTPASVCPPGYASTHFSPGERSGLLGQLPQRLMTVLFIRSDKVRLICMFSNIIGSYLPSSHKFHSLPRAKGNCGSPRVPSSKEQTYSSDCRPGPEVSRSLQSRSHSGTVGPQPGRGRGSGGPSQASLPHLWAPPPYRKAMLTIWSNVPMFVLRGGPKVSSQLSGLSPVSTSRLHWVAASTSKQSAMTKGRGRRASWM